MSTNFRAGSPLHLLSATLATIVGLPAVDFLHDELDFKIGFNHEFQVGDLIGQAQGWTGSAWWTGSLTGPSTAPGIAITSANFENMDCWYQRGSDGWVQITIEDLAQPLLLGPADLFRVTSNYTGDKQGSTALGFRLWDPDSGTETPTLSAGTADLVLNTRPEIWQDLDPETPEPDGDDLQRIEVPLGMATADAGFDLHLLLRDVAGRNAFSDVDAEPDPTLDPTRFGIAIYAATDDDQIGHWQFLLPGDDPVEGWQDIDGSQIGNVLDMETESWVDRVLLLAGTHITVDETQVFTLPRLRFVYESASETMPMLEYHVWDRSDEALGRSSGTVQTLPAAIDGYEPPTFPYSAGTLTASVADNHAPVHDGNPISVSGVAMAMDLEADPGVNRVFIPVADLMAGFTDGDGDRDTLGIVITDLEPDETASGTWEIYEGDDTWTNLQSFGIGQIIAVAEGIQAAEPPSSGFFLPADALLRYTPNSIVGYQGPVTISDLAYKCWDGTDGLDNAVVTEVDPQRIGGIGSLSVVTITSFSLQVSADAATVTISDENSYPWMLDENGSPEFLTFSIDTNRPGGTAILASAYEVSFSADGEVYGQPVPGDLAWITIDDSGVGVDAPRAPGFWRITVWAEDSLSGTSDPHEVILQITGAPENHAPVFAGEGAPPALTPAITPVDLDLTGAAPGQAFTVRDLVAGFQDADAPARLAAGIQAAEEQEINTPAGNGDLGIVITRLDTSHGFWEHIRTVLDPQENPVTTTTRLDQLDGGQGYYCDPSDQLRFTYTTVPDGDPTTTALLQSLAFRAWDGTDGTASGTTAHPIPAFAANGALSEAAQDVTMPVNVPAATVAITSTDTISGKVGLPFTATITATTSRDGGTVAIAATALPTWLTLGQTVNGSATLTGTPPAGSQGELVVALTASDAQLGTTGQSLTITIAPTVVAFTRVPPASLAVATRPFATLATATSDLAGAPAVVSVVQPSWLTATTIVPGIALIAGTPPSDASGPITVQLAASNGFTSQSASFTLAVFARASVPVLTPALALTGADGTPRFTAIGGGTPEGLDRILAALAGRDATQVRSYAWNAQTQDYVELNATKPAWLTPEHAMFIVTRIDLELDLDGTPQAMPGLLTLQPGWNFLTVPPLTTDGTTAITSHPWANFQVQDVAGTPLAALPEPWLWDGETYRRVGTLTSGVGYWIKNPDASVRRLVRLADVPAVAPRLLADRGRQTADETPPPPPGQATSNGASDADAEASGGGSCGMGNGVAGLFLMLFAALRLFITRPGNRR